MRRAARVTPTVRKLPGRWVRRQRGGAGRDQYIRKRRRHDGQEPVGIVQRAVVFVEDLETAYDAENTLCAEWTQPRVR